MHFQMHGKGRKNRGAMQAFSDFISNVKIGNQMDT
jgi:hypothetical protein